ncbi:hypothetical protein DV737_g2466, partial [Chaetothyriales sp. CBS 132003]
MLSRRGHRFKEIGYEHGAHFPYHPDTNPTGVVDFTIAENYLIHDDLIEFIHDKEKFAKECCTYGEGYTGTLRLRRAMATHLNEYFQPVTPLHAEAFTFAAGVTEVNEMVAMLTCDDYCADAVLIGRPNYGSFARDMVARGGIGQVFVDFHDVDQFSPAGVEAYAQAYEKAGNEGHKIRALVICNPNNPLGQCYTRAGLIALMEFCQAKQIHLISDEIYGLSTYARADRPAEPFVSVYAVDIAAHIDPNLVHVMYGLSKDYGAAGLRLGCLITHNADFASAARGLWSRFSSPSQFSMSLAADLLEDRAFLRPYLAKSLTLLSQARLVAEQALDEAGLNYHRKGNAGLFIWLDLCAYLPRPAAGEDTWAAEKGLLERMRAHGVALVPGQCYHMHEPGHFRMTFSTDARIVREGVKRIKAACIEPQ